ncbi:MAG: carbohydrate kinase family protein [Candidatus Hadarchaeia archaeon]
MLAGGREKMDEKTFESEAPDVISVGNLNIDLIGELDRMPEPDEKTLLRNFARHPGGGAANFAVALEKMGIRSELVARSGKGRFGKELMDSLREFDVGCRFVKRVDTITGFAFVFSTRKGERFLMEHRGANEELVVSDVEDWLMERAELLHGSSLNPRISLELGKKAKDFDLLTSLDLGAELSKLSSDELLEIFKHYDICFMNRGTFVRIFEEKPSEGALSKYIPANMRFLAVTLGSEGALVTDGLSEVRAPGFDVKVESTTGAGDAFAAGFNRCLLSGWNLEESVEYASAAASLKVQNGRFWRGFPTHREVEDFIESCKGN